MEEPLNSETAILKAAEKVFLEKGYDGASMQMISNEAGINKALLHYYFRSKDKLFDKVFQKLFSKLIPAVMEVISSSLSFDRKIEVFVDHYIKTIQQNPLIPVFILHELTRNPEKLLNVFKNTGIDPSPFLEEIEKEIARGYLEPIEPRELVVNILALCIFPFAGKPLLKGVLFQGDEDGYNAFTDKRRKTVAAFILNAIKKK